MLVGLTNKAYTGRSEKWHDSKSSNPIMFTLSYSITEWLGWNSEWHVNLPKISNTCIYKLALKGTFMKKKILAARHIHPFCTISIVFEPVYNIHLIRESIVCFLCEWLCDWKLYVYKDMRSTTALHNGQISFEDNICAKLVWSNCKKCNRILFGYTGHWLTKTATLW